MRRAGASPGDARYATTETSKRLVPMIEGLLADLVLKAAVLELIGFSVMGFHFDGDQVPAPFG